MIRLLITISLFLLHSSYVFGQKQILVTSVNEENFPRISLAFKYYYPEKLSPNEIKILENQKAVLPNLDSVAPNISPNEALNVLILFEDLASRPHQKNFYKKILQETLPELPRNIRFNVAFFDRARDGKKLLRFLFPDFRTDTKNLLEKVNAYQTPEDAWSKQKSSELYLAIDKALNYLSSKYAGKNNIILLFTAGYNLPASNVVSLESILAKSKEKHIPVYVLQYFHYEHRPLEKLAKDSYGMFEFTKNPATGKQALKAFLSQALPRLKGFQYFISYKTSFLQDGNQHLAVLKVQNNEEPFYFRSPCNFICMIKKHWILFLLAILLIIGTAVAITYWFKGKQTPSSTPQTQTFQYPLKNEKKEEFSLPEEVASLEIRQAFQGKFPVLTEADTHKKFHLNISPLIFGRGSMAHLKKEKPSVSRKHAVFYFDKEEKQFFITDLGSSNGTEINGEKLKPFHPYLLKDRDVITFAKEFNYIYTL